MPAYVEKWKASTGEPYNASFSSVRNTLILTIYTDNVHYTDQINMVRLNQY